MNATNDNKNMTVMECYDILYDAVPDGVELSVLAAALTKVLKSAYEQLPEASPIICASKAIVDVLINDFSPVETISLMLAIASSMSAATAKEGLEIEAKDAAKNAAADAFDSAYERAKFVREMLMTGVNPGNGEGLLNPEPTTH